MGIGPAKGSSSSNGAAIGNGSGSRGGPVSIEELLAKQKSSKEDAAKPRFTTKSERAAQALAKRKAEVEAQKEAEKALAKSSLKPQPTAAPSSRRDDGRLPPSGPRGGHYPQQQQQQYGRSSYAQQQPPHLPRDRPPPPPPPPASSSAATPAKRPFDAANNNNNAPFDASLPVVDAEAIKARYLGGAGNEKKKRTRKQNDKKFNFDWDQEDDTGSGEVDPLYKNLHASGSGHGQSVALFGRGRLAGYADVLPEHAPARPLNGTHQDPDDMPLAGPTVQIKKSSGRGFDDRHWSEKGLSEMKDRDWRIFREDFSIAARGGNIPHPIRNWDESNIPPQILEVIDEIGYKEPSAIQRQAIPIGMQNRDLIGIAETGSGKTASFVIPMLDYIGKLPPLTDENRHLGPYAIVLAPTRELAQQIEGETTKFAVPLGYRCISIVGGKSMEEQAQSLSNGAEILIASPGRLKDVLEQHVLVLSQCAYVIMDEADRMVSLGFEETINAILDALPVTNLKPDSEEAEDPSKMKKLTIGENGQTQLYRQTVMFSATMPPAVERLARKYMRRPAVVTIGVAGQAVDTVEQRVEFLYGDDKKKQRLVEILNSNEFAPPIIVFVNQKRSADQLARDVNRAKWSATTLHSDKNQAQREAALASLRSGEVDVLVATDLAGRGIDVPDVSLVVNFQMATTIEAYVHRIGRTGRAGKTGVAVTFLSNDDADVMYDLKQELIKSPLSKCPQELMKHEAAQQRMTRDMRRMRQDAEHGSG